MNEEVELSFFPVGHFLTNSTHGANAAACPNFGEDKHCQGDKFEACILQEVCGGVHCEADDQVKLADFLACFEGGNRSKMASAHPCAAKAGIRKLDTVMACASNSSRSDSAFAAVREAAKPGMANAKCFPWVVIDGTVASTDPREGCFGKDAGTAPLLPMLCDAIGKGGQPAPAGCP